MQLLDQHAKGIMEECKSRARDAGLRFDDETLEYIVSNRDMLELSPKNMIPTLYDYWMHDVNVLREKGKYELYPHNPYETVIKVMDHMRRPMPDVKPLPYVDMPKFEKRDGKEVPTENYDPEKHQLFVDVLFAKPSFD